MVVQGPGNRSYVHRSRSVEGIDGKGERNRRMRREIDCPDLSMENSDGSQECVLPLAKRRLEKRQELLSLRSYQLPSPGLIRNTVRPGPSLMMQNYQRANSAEALSCSERTPNKGLRNNGVIQRRLLRRRSFGGLDDNSDVPGESSPLPVPRNHKCCGVVMAEIVQKLKGDNLGKDATQSQRFDPLDQVASVYRPLVSVSQHSSKPAFEKEGRMKRRGSTGHLQDRNTRMQPYSMDRLHFLSGNISLSNHETSPGQKQLSIVQGKHQQVLQKLSPDKKESLRHEKKSIERRIRREMSTSSCYSRREMIAREKQKMSPIDIDWQGQDSFATEHTNLSRSKHADQRGIKNDDSPLTVPRVATDYLRTSDRGRRPRPLQRNLSGPLVKPVRDNNVNSLATAVAKEELFLIWLKQQNSNNKTQSDTRISSVSAVHSSERNARPTRQGATTLSDRRAMRGVRSRNSQSA